MESDERYESYSSKSVDSFYGLSEENMNTTTTSTTVTYAATISSTIFTSAWRINPTTTTPLTWKSNARNVKTTQRRSPTTSMLAKSGERLMPKLKGSDIIGSGGKSWHWESESVESTLAAVKRVVKGLKSKEKSWHWESLTKEESDESGNDNSETTKKMEDIRNSKSPTDLKHASSENGKGVIFVMLMAGDPL